MIKKCCTFFGGRGGVQSSFPRIGLYIISYTYIYLSRIINWMQSQKLFSNQFSAVKPNFFCLKGVRGNNNMGYRDNQN